MDPRQPLVFSSNTDVGTKEAIVRILQVQEVDHHGMYLGMPSAMGRTKRDMFAYIREHVWSRIQGWGERQPSIAGREILIKAVLQAVPQYVMGVFLLPQALTHELTSIIRKFWWQSSESKGISWKKWDHLCTAKKNGGLGFRELRAFNFALLAKQGWRIVQYPDSLVARILKARYFRNCSFLDASTGSRSSLTWKNILLGRKYLLTGLSWRVGNGQQIRVFSDAWLPGTSECTTITIPNPVDRDMRVSDLIDDTRACWKVEEVSRKLWPVDVNRVLGVPLGHIATGDKLIWRFSPNGLFTVRSCYHAIRHHSRADKTLPTVSTSGEVIPFWSLIWNAKIQNRVKLFLWRTAWNRLPTRCNLFRRNVPVDVVCPVCEEEMEDVWHILFGCAFAREVWSLTTVSFNLVPPVTGVFPQWLYEVSSELGDRDFALFGFCCRALWLHRNTVILKKKRLSAMEVATQCRALMEEFVEANKLPVRNHTRESTKWQPPCEGTIKVNFDGAMCSITGRFRFAMVARDWEGRVIWWDAKTECGVSSPIDVEARATQFAVYTSLGKGWRSICFEGDNSTIMKALECSNRGFESYGALLESCKIMSSTFSSVSFSFTRREGNELAHFLAKHFSLMPGDNNVIPDIAADVI